jgi:hypothetical protein
MVMAGVGEVLRPFVLGDDPYTGGQHRGIDVEGQRDAVVPAPSAGVVSFAGSVGTNGKIVTIETRDGYSVTLVHLGSFSVAKGEVVREGASVGTIGPSGTPEHEGQYVHLGVRTTADPNGYVDPQSLLPSPRAEPVPFTGARTCARARARAATGASSRLLSRPRRRTDPPPTQSPPPPVEPAGDAAQPAATETPAADQQREPEPTDLGPVAEMSARRPRSSRSVAPARSRSEAARSRTSKAGTSTNAVAFSPPAIAGSVRVRGRARSSPEQSFVVEPAGNRAGS